MQDQEMLDVPNMIKMNFTKKAKPSDGEILWVVDLRREKAHKFETAFNGLDEMNVEVGTLRLTVKQKDCIQTDAASWRWVFR